MGTWEVGASAPGTGYCKGHGPKVTMSLGCSRKRQKANVTAWE